LPSALNKIYDWQPNVLGMVIVHSNGRTYSNAYLITFKVGPLFTHKLAPWILPLLEAPAEGFFWNLPELGNRIRLHALHGCETSPLVAHFQKKERPKVIRSEIGGYGGCVMTGIASRQAMCGSVRCRDAKTKAPA
jgi:hypothetical protein